MGLAISGRRVWRRISRSVGPQAFQHPGHGRRGAAGEGAAVCVKAHGDEYGQSGIFLCSQQRRLGLVQVRHGFDHDQVRAVALPADHHFGKKIVSLLEGQRSQRLQQRAQRPHVQGGQRAGALQGVPGGTQAGGNDFIGGMAGFFQLEPVGPEGVGVDHLAARGQVSPVHALDAFGLRQVPHLGVFPGTKSAALQHGSHGAVQQDAFVQIKWHGKSPFPARCRCFSGHSTHSP